MAEKSTSLKELGFTIKGTTGKDEKGNEICFKVTGPVPTYWVKKTKRGRLIAVKEKDSVAESTVEGLYDFKYQDGDLVGKRQASTSTAKATPAVAA
jgi:hypothetical protein